jgi:hypothetical protein
MLPTDAYGRYLNVSNNWMLKREKGGNADGRLANSGNYILSDSDSD